MRWLSINLAFVPAFAVQSGIGGSSSPVQPEDDVLYCS